MKKVKILSWYQSLLVVTAVLFFTLSCGGQRTFQTDPPTTGLGEYVIVEIPDFKTSLTGIPPNAVWRIPNGIAEELKEEDVFVGVSRSPVDISERVLVLNGTIVNLTPRTWYEQIVKTVDVTVNVRFVDKSDNVIVAEATFQGTSKAGALSGGVPFAYVRLADEIVQYMKLNLR